MRPSISPSTKGHLTTNPRSSREILQGDFLKFVWFVWREVLKLPKPTRVQLDIARYLAGGPKRRFIQAFRGIGKSFLTCSYAVWKLWKNPNLKVLIVSAGEKAATDNANLIKQIIEHPAGDELWPELRTRAGQRSSTLAFDVGPALPDKQPSVKVIGITGQLAGNRADILISDDVEAKNNSETETKREALADRTAEYAAILKTTEEAETIYLGTPQTEESVYRKLPAKGYEVRIWPARYPTAERMPGYQGFLAPMLLADIEADPEVAKPIGTGLGGKPTDPERFTELQLLEKEAELGGAGFLLQMQLDTSLSDAERYPLKTRDLIVMDVDRLRAPVAVSYGSSDDLILKGLANVGFEGDRLYRPLKLSESWADYTGAVMHIDPSGSGADETSYVVTKFLNGWVYVRRWGGLTDGKSEATLEKLAQVAAEEEVGLIVTEDNWGDGMFRQLLEPVVRRKRPCAIDGVKVKGQKEVRIVSTLEPVLRQHRVVIDAQVVRDDLAHPDASKRGLYQMTHLTTQRGSLKHDDRIDVLAQAVAYWADRLRADTEKAEEEWKRAQARAFDREFYRGVTVMDGQGSRGGRRRAVGRRVR